MKLVKEHNGHVNVAQTCGGADVAPVVVDVGHVTFHATGQFRASVTVVST